MSVIIMFRPGQVPENEHQEQHIESYRPGSASHQPEHQEILNDQPFRLRDLQRLGDTADEQAPDTAYDSDTDPLLSGDFDYSSDTPPSTPLHLATEAPGRLQKSLLPDPAVVHAACARVSPAASEAVTADIAEPIETVTAVIAEARLDDFRESEREPEAATSPGGREKRVAGINRKYWGKHQAVERDRRSELKAHGEQGYRLPEEVLTNVLCTRLDDLDCTDGIEKELKAAGVPADKAAAVKTSATRSMKAALANVANHPNMQLIQAEALTKGSIRSSESVGAVMTSIRRSGLIARELSALRSDVGDLKAWKADAEPRLRAVEEAVGRKPTQKETALQMLLQGRTQQEVAAAVGTSTRTLIRWKKAFESAGKL